MTPNNGTHIPKNPHNARQHQVYPYGPNTLPFYPKRALHTGPPFAMRGVTPKNDELGFLRHRMSQLEEGFNGLRKKVSDIETCLCKIEKGLSGLKEIGQKMTANIEKLSDERQQPANGDTASSENELPENGDSELLDSDFLGSDFLGRDLLGGSW